MPGRSEGLNGPGLLRADVGDMMAACHAGCCFYFNTCFCSTKRRCDRRVCVPLSIEGEFEVKCVCVFESQTCLKEAVFNYNNSCTSGTCGSPHLPSQSLQCTLGRLQGYFISNDVIGWVGPRGDINQSWSVLCDSQPTLRPTHRADNEIVGASVSVVLSPVTVVLFGRAWELLGIYRKVLVISHLLLFIYKKQNKSFCCLNLKEFTCFNLK